MIEDENSRRVILLWDLPDQIALIVSHPTGVIYENQVGGNVCWAARLEGALSPLDVSIDGTKRLQECPYPTGRGGISEAVADSVDGILNSEPGARFLKVDRTRLGDCWEAWIYVVVDSPGIDQPRTGPNFGPARGFGTASGVLTWPNSD